MSSVVSCKIFAPAVAKKNKVDFTPDKCSCYFTLHIYLQWSVMFSDTQRHRYGRCTEVNWQINC